MRLRTTVLLAGALLLASAMLLAGCGAKEEDTGLPNPASVYCEEQGGKLEIRTDASGGQYGVCVFDDGSECDEWMYYRGECKPGDTDRAPEPGQSSGAGLANPAAVFCEEQGGKVEIRADSAGNQYGVCKFDDGTECDEWAYFRAECKPGDMERAPEPGQ
jgi:putative hemolysin